MHAKQLHFQHTTPNFIIQLPASKSISNRALILSALAYSPYEINNISDCDDTQVTLKALNSNDTHFDIGAAGTAMRFLTAFLSKTVGEWVITGSERMKQRPIKLLVDALNSLGARIEYLEKEGFPPLRIFGSALNGGDIQLNGSVSSQYISALMMVAPYMLKGLKIKLEGHVISVPYILMTKAMMAEFGVHVSFENNIISIEPQSYRPIPYQVESDWSAASYWYEIVALAGSGKVSLKGLHAISFQGDSKVAVLFERLGVHTEFQEDGVIITPHRKLATHFEHDFVNEPDLAQTFAVSCCLKNITFHFKGLQSLKIKETNRILALTNELAKLGFQLAEPAEGELAWDGTKTSVNVNRIPTIETYDDHRMAMAFAPVALLQPIIIQHPEVVSKSYPNFWNDLELLNQ
ncbi:MAG: 3-phosphoshikimate 1-carboxyvinyltransferase [Porphyromonadaceae bacterium CG2_30_38_12]|nr:MAG: 3-phosphoshikimate 1-carboxyvinyltransferase [Porphyromonadaceae bacterium CG2_30_38_12]